MEENKLLFEACRNGDLETLKQLLREHPEWIHEKSIYGGGGLLHFAKTPEMAAWLLECGIPLDVKDRHHLTPLLFAAYGERWDVVDFLLSKGADLYARDKEGRSLLDVAVARGNFKLAHQLLDQGFPAQFEGTPTFALCYASAKGALQLVRRLLELGADVNTNMPVLNDLHPSTPLGMVVCFGQLEVARFLLESGANPEKALFRLFPNGVPFSVKKEMFFLLLRHGARMIFPNTTILHRMAAESDEWIPVMKQLPELREWAGMRDEEGCLPQHYAKSRRMFDFLAEVSGNQGDKRLNSREELGVEPALAKWIFLHPERDELLVIHKRGKISRWRYAPDFQWVEGVRTNQKEIKRIAVSPDGECFAIVAPHLWGVEVRSADGLAVKRHLSEKSLTEYYALCFSADGARLMVDCFSDDYGVAQFDVETGACHFHYCDDYLDFEYGKWSPDGKWFAYVTIFEDDDFTADGLYVRPVGEHSPDHEKFYELPPRRNIEFLWDIHWSPDSKRVVYYAELFNFETKCREGHLIACCLVENRVLWDVHVTLEKKINPVKVPKTTRVLSLGREVVCFTPDGRLIFFDAGTGKRLREVRMNGETILAIGLHPDGDKLRVATDREMQVVEWKA